MKIRIRFSFLTVLSAVVLLAACQSPTTDVRKLDFSKDSAIPLPVDATVALVMAPDARNNTIPLTLTNLMRTKVRLREGWAITDGAKKVLKKAFRTVVIDDVSDKTDLVISLKGQTKIDTFWLTYNATTTAKVYLADGTPLGEFVAQNQVTGDTAGSDRMLRDVYIKTLEQIVPQLLKTPAFVQRFGKPGGARVALDQRALESHLGYPLKVAVAETAPAPRSGLVTARAPAPPPAKPAKTFPKASMNVAFPSGPARPDDIAVIIGNADYGSRGKDIPDVTPAHADADAFKQYAVTSLGIREGNIIDLRDATQADLITVFGSEASHKGKLFNWVQPDISRVVVYYAGHGAPGEDASAYLMPVDADPTTLHLNGIQLEQLYANLAKLPARSVTVILEACFSGASQGGSVISNASPVFLRTKASSVPKGITVISAGGSDQLASWEEDGSHGLFTKYYLKGMSGEADAAPHGNGDGTVALAELKSYLKRTLTYYARRYYGRDQSVQIVSGSEK